MYLNPEHLALAAAERHATRLDEADRGRRLREGAPQKRRDGRKAALLTDLRAAVEG